MRRCHLLIKLFSFIFILFLVFPLRSAERDFLPGTEDVPLMADLKILQEDTFDFENENGRLYFSKAYSLKDIAIVKSFYQEVLHQLGWIEQSSGAFERDGDILKIDFSSCSGKLSCKTLISFELIIKSK